MASNPLKWDDYKDCSPEEGVRRIYEHILRSADEIVGWYWKSIRSKRLTALVARGAAFVLLIAGTGGQILASTLEAAVDRLTCTQVSLVLLATAALLLTGDRTFGWTSGWTRYITTAMAMERLVQEFRLQWAKVLFTRPGPLERADALALFDLAQALELQLLKAQNDETTAWATEFSAGLQLLDAAIKVQREAQDKQLDELRTRVDRPGGA